MAIVDFVAYVASDGMECQGDSCSTVVDVTGALFYPLVIVGVALLLAVVAKVVARAAGSSQSGGTR